MGELIAYGNEITNVFQLMGKLENDITKSVAWALTQCPAFTKLIIEELLGIECNPDLVRIEYQQWNGDKGITDLELTDLSSFYIIIEAKRGWVIPGEDQLTKYSLSKGISESTAAHKAIVTMSECSIEYARAYMPMNEVNGIPIRHLAWRRLNEIAVQARANSNLVQRYLLDELIRYFGGIMTMQNKLSNQVYIVSLSRDKAEGGDITFLDIVEKKGKYYHSVGRNGWPKEPPNYIAFRYDGRLQSIHHIESYTVTRNMHDEIPEMPDEERDHDHFVYTLGPAIRPSKKIVTGNIYASGRRWAMLDLLLTCDSISEACEKSSERLNS